MSLRLLLTLMFLIVWPVSAWSQNLDLVVPPSDIPVDEADTITVQLETALGGQSVSSGLTYDVDRSTLPEAASASVDSLGRLRFTAGYDVVTRQSGQIRIPVAITVQDGEGRRGSASVYFLARHVNRPPTVGDVPPGYARPDQTFVWDLRQFVSDPDGDRLRFSIASRDLPENASLKPEGIFTWDLSQTMFRNLPRTIPFVASDGREQVTSQFVIEKTQSGIPPTVTLLGNQGSIVLQEGGRVTLNINVDDPNGADDIANVVATTQIPANNYKFTWPVGNDRSRAEFTFSPSYDFIPEGGKSRAGEVTFTAIDQDKKEAKPVSVQMTVNDVPDPNALYRDYRTALGGATGLLTQLTDRQNKLERRLSRVKTSETVRRVFATLLGMSTTAFSIFAEDDVRKYGTGVSGMLTTGLTGLEAARIFTQSDVIDRQVQEVKTEILRVRFEAESMARDYNSPENRLKGSFAQDRRTLEKLIQDTRTKLKITDDPPAVSEEEIKRFTIYFVPQ